MRSIFLNIFLWFWATVILTAIAVGLSFALQPKTPYDTWQTSQNGISWMSAAYLARTYEHQGVAAANAMLAESRKNSQLNSCLFDATGSPVAGSDCEVFRALVARTLASQSSIPVPALDAMANAMRAQLDAGNGDKDFSVIGLH